ncbi:MAG: hypothetical protein IJG87_06440 [Ruminococcus sp.]|nr:hypothetical protein [Ruminococcus sp.]
MGSVYFSDSYRNPKFSSAPTNYIRVDFTEVEYDLVNNRTKVRLDGVYIYTSAGYIGSSVAYGTLTFNGTTVLSMNGGSYQVQLSTSYSYISSSGTSAVVWIPLNDDGSGSMSVSLTGGTPNADNRSCFGVKNTTYGVFGIRTTETKSVALTKRPRITTVSATDAYIGDPVTITLSRFNADFTHTIKVTCAGNTETVMTKGSTYPTLTWTPALATYAPLITNAMAATATIICETYNGDTLLGQSTATCTLTLKASDVAPSVSIAATDPTGNLTTYGRFVKGKSKITVTLTPTLAYGATLATQSITANGANYTSSPATTDFILSASNTGISATIKDSRGQTATASATIQIFDYDAPKINAFSAHRCNADGTENNAGAYMAVGYSVEVSPLGNQNAKTLTVKYKKISASSWSTATITLSAYTETGVSQPIAVDTNSTYNVQLVLEDDFSTGQSAAVAELVLPTASTRMNWGAGENGGIAIGKVSEYDKTLEIADGWTLKIRGRTIADLIYPVGSIYMSVNSISPAALFGGTWEQIEDTFLLSAGSTYTPGNTGGSATHAHTTGNCTLTVNQIPSHTHGLKGWRYGHNQKYDNYCASYTQLSDAASSNTPILATGGGQAHNHGNTGDGSSLPPYLVVYMWKRVPEVQA